MKLTKEQQEDIKNQQSQSNSTKRVTSTELEKILYEALPALDLSSNTIESKYLKSNSFLQVLLLILLNFYLLLSHHIFH